MRRLLSPNSAAGSAVAAGEHVSAPPISAAQNPAFDAAAAWRRSPSVALRPEPFGALVYHFGNRKLSFLKSPELVRVVQSLADHPSADAAITACGIEAGQLSAYRKALAALARSQMIEQRP